MLNLKIVEFTLRMMEEMQLEFSFRQTLSGLYILSFYSTPEHMALLIDR